MGLLESLFGESPEKQKRRQELAAMSQWEFKAYYDKIAKIARDGPGYGPDSLVSRQELEDQSWRTRNSAERLLVNDEAKKRGMPEIPNEYIGGGPDMSDSYD